VRLRRKGARSLQCSSVHVVYAIHVVPADDGVQRGAVPSREAHPMGAIRRAAQPAMSRQAAQQRHVSRHSLHLRSVASLPWSFASHVCVSAVQIRTKTVFEDRTEPQYVTVSGSFAIGIRRPTISCCSPGEMRSCLTHVLNT